MARLHVKHIGPLQDVHFEVKRVNVFTGPQSSGKSTLAKILSQCIWVEKNFITTGEEYDFYKGLVAFHNFTKSFFSREKESSICYESEWTKIEVLFVEGKRDPQTKYTILKHKTGALYDNVKVQYIPAERNFVVSIPNLHRYQETYNSVISFLSDFYQGKQRYQRKNRFEIQLPQLEFSYRYKEATEEDIITTSSGIELDVQSASSGQQSILPLMLVMKDVLKYVYENTKLFSEVEKKHLRRLAGGSDSILSILLSLTTGQRNQFRTQLDELWQAVGFIGEYSRTHLVVEEPEQNLYPATQRGLIYQMLKDIQDSERCRHTLTITTHSPYILYAVDNCMLAGLLGNKLKDANVANDLKKAAISPLEVALWELKDGRLIDLKSSDGLLGKNHFNDELSTSVDEMYNMLPLMNEV